MARTPWSAPLRPPAPFPSGFMFQNGGNLSRVRKPRRNGAPLTACHRSEDTAEMRERGPSARRAVSRVARGTARYARMRRCLILRQGASPLRPPHFPLDREWPSHGSPEREKLRINTRNRPSRCVGGCAGIRGARRTRPRASGETSIEAFFPFFAHSDFFSASERGVFR